LQKLGLIKQVEVEVAKEQQGTLIVEDDEQEAI
jgi:hypothetical protein